MGIAVGVVDFGLGGNIPSIKAALEAAGGEVEIITTEQGFDRVQKIVIPGVGAYADAMNQLSNSGMLNALVKAMENKPTLGICLGMQLLAKVGFEFGEHKGLGIIDAEVKPIECHGNVPHMGFSSIDMLISGDPLMNELERELFYFMHSYEVVSYKNGLGLTEYCGHQIVSVVKQGHIYGVQFHPEKSRKQGIKLFRNFLQNVEVMK